MITFLERTKAHGDRTAILSESKKYSYDDLHKKSDLIALHLLNGKNDLEEERISFLMDPSFNYTSTQWGIWKAGGIAVPLCVLHPLPSLKHVLQDTACRRIIIEEKYYEFIKPLLDELSVDVILLDSFKTALSKFALPDIKSSRRAMILYTSGTTNLPKGVVTTHRNIESQIQTLVEAWEWTEDDHILNTLPLHHVHGIINVMSCALWSGACCEFLPKFDSTKVWEIFMQGNVNVYMAVPTIYYKLIKTWKDTGHSTREKMSEACTNFRLMVSGSAALPVSVLEEWKKITGQILLERYGMTEIGMALSNPYDGERKPGHVGLPLPDVDLMLVDETYRSVEEGEQGEIIVKGPSVFLEYWNNKNATDEAFTSEGWFKTGDVAVISEGYYKILGRTSVDIIKSGGYKISALEIEEVIRSHDEINDCGVVGLPDPEWGEVVGAAICTSNKSIEVNELKKWLTDRLPNYKIPRKYIMLEDLPRNTLGKVTKKPLKKLF